MIYLNTVREAIPLEPKTFPDGSLHLEIPFCFPKSISWFYENDAELFTLICARRHFADTSLDLYLPYIPHARNDRVKNPEDVFTLKYFCEVINSLNFTQVYVRDAHSNVALALLNNVINQTLDIRNNVFKIIDKISEDFILFYPDEGAMKRYSSLLKLPYTFGIKNREWETGKIKNLILMNEEMVKDKNILIIDDICSYGGTFQFAAEALKKAGARDIYLYISHAEKNMINGAMYNGDLIKKIYTTNSIFKKEYDIKDKVKVFNIFFK